MPLRRMTTVALAAAALGACELTRSPTEFEIEDRVIVESVIVAGDSTARVLIRVISGDYDPFQPFPGDLLPVTDASVRIVVGTDTVSLLTRPDATTNACVMGAVMPQTPAGDLLSGCYVGSLSAPVASGMTYDLIIDIPALGRTTGRTVVPEPPMVTAPGSDAAVPATIPVIERPFTIAWTGTSQRTNVELYAVTADSQCSATILSEAVASIGIGMPPITDGSSSADVTVQLGCGATTPTEVPGELIVTVYDTTFSRYFRSVGDNHRPQDAIAGLDGPVIGVFGSAASARQPVRFVPQ